MRKLLLGLDIGSSSVKASLLDASTGKSIASKAFPEEEMPINAPQTGWAEQDPEMWWTYVKETIAFVCQKAQVKNGELKGIGIATRCTDWSVWTKIRRYCVLRSSGATAVLLKLVKEPFKD